MARISELYFLFQWIFPNDFLQNSKGHGTGIILSMTLNSSKALIEEEENRNPGHFKMGRNLWRKKQSWCPI